MTVDKDQKYGDFVARPLPNVRIKVLQNGNASGSVIASLGQAGGRGAGVISVTVPPSGADGWMNAATWTCVDIAKVQWYDLRRFYGIISLRIDSLSVGEPTPFVGFYGEPGTLSALILSLHLMSTSVRDDVRCAATVSPFVSTVEVQSRQSDVDLATAGAAG